MSNKTIAEPLYVIRVTSPGGHVGYHTGSWPSANFDQAKLYQGDANIKRALRYHGYKAGQRNVQKVEVVKIAVTELEAVEV